MLQEFRVDNFKSLINIVFGPQTTNLLLGMNNSGKTNLCQALRFMSLSSALSLDLCADGCGGRFGMTSFTLDKSTIDFYVRAAVPYEDEELVFEYELTVSPPGSRAGETSVRLDHSAARPQLIFTSHAPYFIDLFDEHLGGIFVLDRSRGHTSITQPDMDEVRARLEHSPLGEQHFREMPG